MPAIGAIQWWVMRTGARGISRACLDLRVEGLPHLPPTGPAIVAARHFHHFFDACALIATLPRPLHFVVAVDWMTRRRWRAAAELGFATVHWPTVVRSDGLVSSTRHTDPALQTRYLRRAVAESVRVLQAGHIVVFFPEGHPNVDPGETPKKGDAEAFLPFQPGFLRLAEIAGRALPAPIPIVPAGLQYQRGRRWRVALRFGQPMMATDDRDRACLVRSIEDEVRRLSGLPIPRDAPLPRDVAAT